jgi:acetyl esterase
VRTHNLAESLAIDSALDISSTELVSRAHRNQVEKIALSATRGVLWLAEFSVPLCAALTRDSVQLQRNIPYADSGDAAHTLDVFRPADAPLDASLPAVMYVHGGAFEACSKDTHWLLAQTYARAGYVVFNVNYRLAPEHPYPAAIQDVAAAYSWVLDNAHQYGADATRVAVAGESAGANLVTSLALMCSVDRPEPWARALYERNRPPKAVIAACGLFEVSRPDRFRRMGPWAAAADFFKQVAGAYLPHAPRSPSDHDLANPLRALERLWRLERPLPPFFLPCGERDPLLNDTQRMEHTLRRHGTTHEARYYAAEVHAFHAMGWRPAAKRCWQQTFRFLDRHLHSSATHSSEAA